MIASAPHSLSLLAGLMVGAAAMLVVVRLAQWLADRDELLRRRERDLRIVRELDVRGWGEACDHAAELLELSCDEAETEREQSAIIRTGRTRVTSPSRSVSAPCDKTGPAEGGGARRARVSGDSGEHSPAGARVSEEACVRVGGASKLFDWPVDAPELGDAA